MSFITPDRALNIGSLTGNPPVAYRFIVTFLAGGLLPNPLDVRFKKVSGLSATAQAMDVREGGENLFQHRLPNGIGYGNLVLERGLVMGSPLNLEFNEAMSLFQYNPGNVLVTLLDDAPLINVPGTNPQTQPMVPGASWLFRRAWPSGWTVSDLDAEHNGLVIDTLELTFTRFQNVRL